MTAPPCLIHSVDAFCAWSLELYRLLQDVNESIANRRIDPPVIAIYASFSGVDVILLLRERNLFFAGTFFLC